MNDTLLTLRRHHYTKNERAYRVSERVSILSDGQPGLPEAVHLACLEAIAWEAQARARMASTRLDAQVHFLRTHAASHFVQWSDDLLRAYLRFHSAQQGLACEWRAAGDVIALAVGWRVAATTVRQPEFTACPARFHDWNPQGDAVYVDCLVAPAGGIRDIIWQFIARVPNWRSLKFFLHRRGVLKEYAVNKFMHRLYAWSCPPQPTTPR